MVLDELVSIGKIETTNKIFELILVLKALGIAAIVYIVYMIIVGIFNYRRMRRVEDIGKKTDIIEKRVVSIDKKLNKLVKKI